ncbi:hypothetical protein KFL_011980010, partial [Klebsormidium nitens]
MAEIPRPDISPTDFQVGDEVLDYGFDNPDEIEVPVVRMPGAALILVGDQQELRTPDAPIRHVGEVAEPTLPTWGGPVGCAPMPRSSKLPGLDSALHNFFVAGGDTWQGPRTGQPTCGAFDPAAPLGVGP